LSNADREDIAEFLKTRCGEQITKAFLCPLNRHVVRLKLKCPDEDLAKQENANALVEHFIFNGGKTAFDKEKEDIEKKRKEEEKNMIVEKEVVLLMDSVAT
jgi:hypothetical protein